MDRIILFALLISVIIISGCSECRPNYILDEEHLSDTLMVEYTYYKKCPNGDKAKEIIIKDFPFVQSPGQNYTGEQIFYCKKNKKFVVQIIEGTIINTKTYLYDGKPCKGILTE